MIIGPHWFYRQKYEKKHTLHPSILGVRDRETSFAPEYTRGPRLKG